jgi:uncharacterized protein
MKLLDANILLYAYNADSPHHAASRSWLEHAFNDQETIGIAWQTILAFVRIGTNPRAVRTPLTAGGACDIVTEWLSRPSVLAVEPGERFWDLLREQLIEARVSGPLVSDAALVALALEQGATLISTDKDFRRFRGLKLVDPLHEAH